MKNPSKPVFLAILMAAASPLSAQTLYWDTNGATPGAGNPANGTWDAGTTANWSTSAAGDVATTTFTNGDSIVFSAGNDAATAAVTVVGAPTTNSITFQEGTTTLSGANFDNFGTGSIQYTVLNGAHGIINQSTGAYNADFDVQGNGTLFINDVRGGGTTAKTGTGTLTVNRLDSVLTVNGGTVIYNGGGVNAKLKNTTINNGGTLVLNGASFDGVGRNLAVNAGGRFEMATGLSQEVNSLSGAGSLSGGSGSNLTVKAGTFSGAIEDGLSLTVNAATSFTLADNSTMEFVIGASGVNNSIGGTGILNLNGDFIFNLSGAAAVGSWTIVNVGTLAENYGATFEVQGFTETSAGVWQFGDYTFTEATGVLNAVPEPSAVLMTGFGLALVLWRGARRHREA